MITNILIVSLDAVRADHLSCYGYQRDTTPFLREFSSQSLKFEYAYSAANWTLPSHISMMTGMSMDKHGIGTDRTGARKLADPRIITMAEYLRAIGFDTMALTNCGYLSRETHFDRGFDYFNYVEDLIGRNHPFYSIRVFGKYWARVVSGFYHRHLYKRKDYGAERTLHLFQDWIDHRRNRSQPFFGFLHFFETHAPYHVPPAFSGTYSPSSKEREEWLDVHKSPWYHLTGNQRISESQFGDMIDAYDGAILYIDQVLQKLVAVLEKRKLLHNTAVIITADHGESLGEHGSVGHAGDSLSESVIRVPLILYFPERLSEAKQITRPVAHIDLFPTVLDLIGDKEDYLGEQLQGTSVLDSQSEKKRVVVSESLTMPLDRIMAKFPGVDLEKYNQYLRTARVGQHKLVVSSRGNRQLFNVVDDPAESTDLSEQIPETTSEISVLLDGWLASYHQNQGVRSLIDLEMDNELRTRLINLGYLE